MANLLGQNIGTNYKGILNLNTLNGNLSGTLQAVTDGDGNASPLQLSTTNLAMTFADTSGLFYGPYSAGGVYSGIWDNKLGTKDTSNVSFLLGNSETYVNGISGIYFSVNGPSATLAVLKSNGFGVGITTANPSARLQVRGDGTNPIARFESNAAVQILGVNNNFITIGREGNIGPNIYAFNSTPLTPDALGFGLAFASFKTNFSTNNYDVYFSGVDYTNTTGTANHISIKRTFAAEAGAGNYRPFNIEYTINNSGAQTGTATGIFLNATETALNGMTHNLMDLQVGGVSQFRVSRIGDTTSNGTFVSLNSYTNFIGNRFQISSGLASNRTLFVAVGEGIMRISDATEANFNRLQLGGTTNAFPAIKRNGAGIDFRLADDSGFCDISSSKVNSPVFNSSTTIDFYAASYFTLRPSGGGTEAFVSAGYTSFGGVGSNSGSCVFELLSTTKGFLPPRMTTTQKNAIATPATGLVLYDTTLNKLAVYTGSAWETVTSL
jgi:hypothetical protein